MAGDPATSTSTADRVFSRSRYFINSGGATVDVDPTYANLADSGGGIFGPITESFLVRTTVPLPPAIVFLASRLFGLMFRRGAS